RDQRDGRQDDNDAVEGSERPINKCGGLGGRRGIGLDRVEAVGHSWAPGSRRSGGYSAARFRESAKVKRRIDPNEGLFECVAFFEARLRRAPQNDERGVTTRVM